MNPIGQLAGLTPQQSEAATQSGAVLVLAGAGTRTLTQAVVHRIEVRGVPASRILAVTFTNQAAGEMAERIRTALGGEGAPNCIGTFHGLDARQLRIDPEIAGLRPGFDIIDADDSRRIVKRVLKAMNLQGGEEILSFGRDPLKTMCNRLSKFKDSLIARPAQRPILARGPSSHRTATAKPPYFTTSRSSRKIGTKRSRAERAK